MNDTTMPMKVGRRQTARKHLVRAAHKVIGERGFDNATVTEIIQEAGVGVGSFYNNFESKEDLARAAFKENIDEFGQELRELVLHCPDAAVATCYAVRRMIERAQDDAAWAWFIINLEPSTSLFHEVMGPRALIGLQIGIDSGAFDIDDPEAAILAIHAVEVAVVKAMLQGRMTNRDTHRSVSLILRMLGISKDRATYLAGLSMPALCKLIAKRKSRQDN